MNNEIDNILSDNLEAPVKMKKTGQTAFIIDDSKHMRKVIREILEDLGFKVVGEAKDYKSAMSGLSGIMNASMFSPTLITLDILMPEVTGDQMVASVSREYPASKIIMVTSLGNQQTVIKCIRDGAKGFIVKPLSRQKLVTTLDRLNLL